MLSLPQFHGELAEIELWERYSKPTFRKHNDREWKTKGKRINKTVDGFTVSYWSKLFREVKPSRLYTLMASELKNF